ncbi:MAG: hypothetical protein HC822_22815 [Oscillochloris sp.]|nr:hypothetical protein [Oscillochloris sp.]
MPLRVYTIELEQPLLATALVGDPNSTTTYSYIPGSSLRGMFAQRFRNMLPQAAEARFHHLFLSDSVRFLHAYPEIAGKRALPTPQSLRRSRDDDKTLINTAYQQGSVDLRSVKKSFCSFTPDGLKLFEPERDLNIHVQRDPKKGRAWRQRRGNQDEPHGTVFRYEALAAGQSFQAGIIFDDPQDADDIDALLAQPQAWIGRSRSAGYGRVRIIVPQPQSPWEEVPTPQPTAATFTLTLLSDTVLRDRRGRPVNGADPESLSDALGFAIEIDYEHSRVTATLVGGFNRTWRTPVPQSPALAAGSVFSLRTKNGAIPDATKIAELLNAGIGERRTEGFGRIAFDWLATATLTMVKDSSAVREQADAAEQPETNTAAEKAKKSVPATALPELDAMAQDIAVTMAERLFDQQIENRIITFVQQSVWPEVAKEIRRNDSSNGSLSMPENSQLARLRTIVRRVQLSPDPASVAAEFARFRPTAMRAYERARIRNQPLRTWIETLLTNPERVWLELFEPEAKAAYANAAEKHSYAAWCAELVSQPNELWNIVCREAIRPVAGQRPAYRTDRASEVALKLLAAVLEAPAQVRKNREEGGNDRNAT